MGIYNFGSKSNKNIEYTHSGSENLKFTIVGDSNFGSNIGRVGTQKKKNWTQIQGSYHVQKRNDNSYLNSGDYSYWRSKYEIMHLIKISPFAHFKYFHITISTSLDLNLSKTNESSLLILLFEYTDDDDPFDS